MAMELKQFNNKKNKHKITDSDIVPSDPEGLVEMKRKRRDSVRVPG